MEYNMLVLLASVGLGTLTALLLSIVDRRGR